MWNWFNCYLSGRHEFGPWCEPGTIFLRCVHCGRRTSGWAIEAKDHVPVHRSVPAAAPRPAAAVLKAATPNRVLPFNRAAAR
jgi:hypothetical protein